MCILNSIIDFVPNKNAENKAKRELIGSELNIWQNVRHIICTVHAITKRGFASTGFIFLFKFL